jgi:hypothetical protein
VLRRREEAAAATQASARVPVMGTPTEMVTARLKARNPAMVLG